MIDKMSGYLVDNVLTKNEEISEERREVLLFGVTRILEDIPKYTVIFLVGYLMNILGQIGVVLLVTMAYKTFVGGAHARTNIQCFILSLIYFLGPVLLARNLILPTFILNIIYALVFVLSIYVLLKIAPADTEEVPIINKGLRKKLRIFGIVSLSSIYLLMLLCIQSIEYRNIIVFTIALIDIMATSVIYKLLKCKYSYESEEFANYFKD